MFKKFVLGAVAVATMGFTASAFAAVTNEQAKEIARKEVPAQAVFYGIDNSNNKITVNFRNNETYKNYDVEVNQETGKVESLDINGSNFLGSTMKTKSEEDVKAAILAAFPDAQNIQVSYEKQGENNMVYNATFETAKYSKVEAEVSPNTCAIGRQKLIFK